MSETVQSYIDKHSLQTKVEDALNACVKAKPDEPLTFMVIAAWKSRLLGCSSSMVTKS